MKKYNILVAVTRFEELIVEADNFDEVEFDKCEIPCYDYREEVEVLNIEEIKQRIKQ